MNPPMHMLVATSAGFAAGELLEIRDWKHGVLTGGAFLTSRLPDWDKRWPLNRFMDHRTVTHWGLSFLVVVSAVLLGGAYLADAGYIDPDWMWVATLSVAIGWGSHLVLDAMTRSGIPFRGPFDTRPRFLMPRGCRVLVGGWVECVLFWALVAAIILWVLL